MIYLDYNATTPVLPEVRHTINAFLDAEFGNPSSSQSKVKTPRPPSTLLRYTRCWPWPRRLVSVMHANNELGTI